LTQASACIRATAVGWNGSRFRRRLRCRRNGIRTRIDRAQRLLINLAGYLQTIANLITPNRRSRLGIFVARNGAVVKTLVLESLLQRTNPLIGTHQTDSAQRDDKTYQRSFHNPGINIRLAIDSYSHVPVRVPAELIRCSTSPAQRNFSLFQNRRRARCQRDGHFDRKRSLAESSEC